MPNARNQLISVLRRRCTRVGMLLIAGAGAASLLSWVGIFIERGGVYRGAHDFVGQSGNSYTCHRFARVTHTALLFTPSATPASGQLDAPSHACAAWSRVEAGKVELPGGAVIPALAPIRRFVDGSMHYEVAAGWPARMFHVYVGTTQPQGGVMVQVGGSNTFGNGPTLSLGPAVVIPFAPIWRGVVLNTLFWSGMAMCGHIVGCAWIRRFRRSRFRCVACGYPCVDSSVRCPECGNAYL